MQKLHMYDCQTGVANKIDKILPAKVKMWLKMTDCVICELLELFGNTK